MTLKTLLAKYRADRTLKNAQALRAYNRAHLSISPFSQEDKNLLADAIHHANRGTQRPPVKVVDLAELFLQAKRDEANGSAR